MLLTLEREKRCFVLKKRKNLGVSSVIVLTTLEVACSCARVAVCMCAGGELNLFL